MQESACQAGGQCRAISESSDEIYAQPDAALSDSAASDVLEAETAMLPQLKAVRLDHLKKVVRFDVDYVPNSLASVLHNSLAQQKLL